MAQEILGILLFVSIFFAGISWYFLGRAIILLIVNDFIWKDFVNDFKKFEDDTFFEVLIFYFFPITLLYLFLTRIFDHLH